MRQNLNISSALITCIRKQIPKKQTRLSREQIPIS